MNDFFIASNRAFPMIFLDKQIFIRQIIVAELDEISLCASPLKDVLNNEITDQSASILLDNDLMKCIELIEALASIPVEILIKFYTSNRNEVAQVLEIILRVNEAYFIDEKPKRSTRKADEKEQTLFDTMQFLISLGHRHEDILKMSYGAFKGYLNAGQRSLATQIKINANTIRVAQHSDKKEYSKFIEGLDPK